MVSVLFDEYRFVVVGARHHVIRFIRRARGRALEQDNDKTKSTWRHRRALSFVSLAAMLDPGSTVPSIPDDTCLVWIEELEESQSGLARATYKAQMYDDPTDLITAVSGSTPELRYLVVHNEPEGSHFDARLIVQGVVDTYEVPDRTIMRIWNAKRREFGLGDPDEDGMDNEDAAWQAEMESDWDIMDAVEARFERSLTKGLVRHREAVVPIVHFFTPADDGSTRLCDGARHGRVTLRIHGDV